MHYIPHSESLVHYIPHSESLVDYIPHSESLVYYIPHSESLGFTVGEKRRTIFLQGLQISSTKCLGFSWGLLVIANIRTPVVCPPSICYRLYRLYRVNTHVTKMPVYSTVRVLILYEKGFSKLDCTKLKSHQLWPKFLLNAVTLCSTHQSYRLR